METKQHELVLNYLKRHKFMTSKDAFELFGILQMPKRILILRRRGYKIKTVMKKGRNRFGAPVQFAEYSLEKK